MPTPPRETNSRIAYTRWEPITDDKDERNSVEFHHFEEEPLPSRFTSSLPRLPSVFKSSPTRNGRTRSPVPTVTLSSERPDTIRHTNHPRFWSLAIRLLSFLIVFGIGWIIGFLVRWGVHTYYIDPLGHCVTPVAYEFDQEIAQDVMDKVNSSSISEFFRDFTAHPHHRVGSKESSDYAKYIAKLWKSFLLERVEIDSVNEQIPKQSAMPSEIRIMNEKGDKIWSISIPELQTAYSANGIQEGRLVYGHFGRFSDFHDMRRLFGYDFKDTVVLIKTYSALYHPASAVRNAQTFGAKAVILFPDPISYILTKGYQLGKLPGNVSLSHSVKFVPGDPMSPYVVSSSTDESTTSTKPRIPVVSISYDDANPLLTNFVNAKNLSKAFWYGLPLNTSDERNFTAAVEVNTEMEKVELKNVFGVIPGRYEPTRYVIIGSHHDTWHQGASRPGVGHSVLMELARVFGEMFSYGWRPGRSILFASWDGEELGHLGSTAWLYRHSKELSSRALAYINLDDLLQGDDNIHVTGSPILRNVIKHAAKMVSCRGRSKPKPVNRSESHCILYDEWLDENLQRPFSQNSSLEGYSNPDQIQMSASGVSVFQSMFGISSLELTLKNKHVGQGDSYPFSKTFLDTKEKVELYLDLNHATIAAKFLTATILQLVMSARLNLLANDYGDSVYVGVQDFLQKNADLLAKNDVDVQSITDAVEKFIGATQRFHSTYDPAPALNMLGHHEFNDQLMELERAFLLPQTSLPLVITNNLASGRVSMQESILNGPFRHVIHGPSLTNLAQMKFLPRLDAAVEVAKAENIPESWKAVKREAFFVVDALDSAACVLDNHLVYTYPFEDEPPPPNLGAISS